MYRSGSLQMAKEIWRKISRIMKTSAKLRNCRASSKNATKLMWTISKYFLNITDIRRYSKNILKMFPLIFLHFFCIFETPPQFCTFAEVFIILEIFLHIFLAIWRPPLLYIYLPKLYQPIKSTHIGNDQTLLPEELSV